LLEGKLEELGIEWLMIVPLRTANEVTGSLTFGSIKAEIYSEEDQAIAQLLASSLASALNNAAIVDDARKRLAQIELINNVSRQLAAMLDLGELLKVAASTIQKTFNYFDVTVFLLSDDKKELVVEAHSGSFIDFLPHGYRQKLGEGIVGWVAENGE